MATDPQLRLQRQDGTDLAAIFHDDAADETVIESLQTGEQWRFRDTGNAIFPGDFDAPSGTIDNLDSANADIDVGSVSTQFQPPRYDTVAAAPDKEGVILVPSSGTDTAGLYINDGSGYELLDESGGASAGSLSGLDIDTDKDFGGFKLTGLGHDEVDVPQVQNRTVADFEGGTLPSDAVGDTADATVQSSVALEGTYSLQLSAPSNQDRARVGFANRKTLVQLGDSLTAYVQLTDTEDDVFISVLSGNVSNPFLDGSFQLRLNARTDRVGVRQSAGGDITTTTAPANVSSNLNEPIRIEATFGRDREAQVSFFNSGGSLLGEVTTTVNEQLGSSGYVNYTAFNSTTTSTVYFDGPSVERRESEDRANTKKGITELGSEVTASGTTNLGPLSVPSDHPNYPVVNMPVTADAPQGETVGYHLAIDETPVLTVEGEADGTGGMQDRKLIANDGFVSLDISAGEKTPPNPQIRAGKTSREQFIVTLDSSDSTNWVDVTGVNRSSIMVQAGKGKSTSAVWIFAVAGDFTSVNESSALVVKNAPVFELEARLVNSTLQIRTPSPGEEGRDIGVTISKFRHGSL